MRVVVVGAGLAGLRVVETLREKGYDGELVLLGEESHLPYDRPPLSKQVLRGDRDLVLLRPEDAYDELRVEVLLGRRATGLDLVRRAVTTHAGEVPFDQVVIATGSVPRRLPGSPGVVLRTADDALALRDRLVPGARLAVVGAGLVGCEVAASARSKGVDVHLVDVLPRPLVRVLGEEVAARVQARHEEEGVVFHLGTSVVAAEPGRLELADGTVLHVDVVLEAFGSRPATEWLDGSGLELHDGVRCDDRGRAADGVWAVGDVARWDGVRHEHWTAAADQARVVALEIAGADPEARGPAYWWSDQYDVKLQGLGQPAQDDEVQVLEAGPRKRPLALYSREGVLTGVVGFSNAAVVFGLRDLIGGPLEEALASVG